MSDGVAQPPEGWFAKLPEADRAALLALGPARQYRPGSALFHEGDLSDWVVLTTNGRVKISATTADGRDVVLAVRDAPEGLGELSALDGRPRSATVTAIDLVQARVVPGERFRTFLEANPHATLLLLKLVTGRLRDADRRRVEFVGLDSVGRVAAQLLELVERFGTVGGDGTTRIDVPLSQDELAGLTGASREAVSKALSLFRRQGWIVTGRRSITVTSIEGLRSRAM
jgi:CRP/FNR family transcriptional regulator, cyclic AMP receptor protein